MYVSCYRERGDPGLSFHKLALLASLAKAGAAAVDEQDFTKAIKLQMKAAIIAQHQEQAEHTSRALRGLAHVSTAGRYTFHDATFIAVLEAHAWSALLHVCKPGFLGSQDTFAATVYAGCPAF